MLRTGAYPLLQAGDSYGLGLMVLLLANYIMVFFHESGHALAVKHFGRSVLKGGMLFYYGSPAYYIDTTDIWMAPKAARIATSLAGPAADMILSGLFALAALLFPASAFSPFLFKLAAVGYLGVLMNLAPVMELDGYYILMDWLEIPLLRKKSLAFVRGPVWQKVPRASALQPRGCDICHLRSADRGMVRYDDPAHRVPVADAGARADPQPAERG